MEVKVNNYHRCTIGTTKWSRVVVSEYRWSLKAGYTVLIVAVLLLGVLIFTVYSAGHYKFLPATI